MCREKLKLVKSDFPIVENTVGNAVIALVTVMAD